jgi:hypothetical protein
MNIIGIDPGETTGVCIWDEDTDKYYMNQVVTDDGRNYYWFLTWLDREIERRYGPKWLVVEKFEFRQSDRHRDKISYVPAEVIGALKYTHARQWTNLNVILVMQGASQGKGFWDDDKIRKLGLWKPGERHAMDALRHVLHYRTFTLGDKSVLVKFKPEPAKEEVQ